MLAKYAVMLFLVLGTRVAADVLELGDSSFTKELERHDETLVMFYTPRCADCSLNPEFVKAAGLLRGNKPPITLAKVDCIGAGKSTCNKYSVTSYPTLKIFSKSKMVYAIAMAPKRKQAQVGPASKELTGEECLKAFLGIESNNALCDCGATVRTYLFMCKVGGRRRCR